MKFVYFLIFLYILYITEGRSPKLSLHERNKNGESYLEVYSCNHPKNSHLHVFTHNPKGKNRNTMKHTTTDPSRTLKYDNIIGNRMFYIGGERVLLTQRLKVSNLTYGVCDESPNNLLALKRIEILNDLVFPGDLSIAFDAVLKVNLPGPIKIKVEAFKQLLGMYVLMPCYEGIGSCTYENACDMLHYKPPCPKDFQRDGIPCACPISKGTYQSKNLTVYAGATNALNFPSWLTDGLYKLKIMISTDEKLLTCISASGSIQQKTD